MKNQFLITALLLTAISVGCGETSSTKLAEPAKTNFIDEAITEFHSLGWIGALAHPVVESISFPNPDDPESVVLPGGLVITEVIKESPADSAGLKKGDVIVGVEDKWMPIKDDPTPDLITQVELNVAAGKDETSLKVFRNGKCETIAIKNTVESLDSGLPHNVVRFKQSATQGLQYLAGLQNEDGSVGESTDDELKLQSTSLAGLAFLASGDEQFQSNIDQCLNYVGQQLDLKIASANKSAESAKPANDAEDDKPKSGMIMMKMPEFELEPLTGATIAQFLAESNVQMIDQKWMPRLMGTLGALSKSQTESGGWNVKDGTKDGTEGDSNDSDEVDEADLLATHTTNQVLMALGMLERKGVMGDAEAVKKACGFLKAQTAKRAGSEVDRRVKNLLSAGTAAAMMSINCKATDSFLKQAIEDGLTKADQSYTAPTLALPGALSTAILARQSGKDAWTQFHAATKYWLSSVQQPDGSFVSVPGHSKAPLDFESQSDPAWEAAHYCLLLAMQTGQLEKLVCKSKSPMMVPRNSAGEKTEGKETADATPEIPGLPAGAKVMSFSMDDLSGEGSMEDQLKEKLKEMGISSDNIKIGNGPPPSGAKKKK